MMGFKDVFSLFCGSWNLYRKFAVSDLGDKELQEFADQATALSRKYNEDKFARDVVLAVIDEIDRIERVKKK
ncbi:hypothetical protein [Muricomes intestini]|jgi:hypothetical protein|uniref:hypothetical protein n=1 Tax=Muricomes intestini TaxID=1796634 RepID=UPI002FDD05A4